MTTFTQTYVSGVIIAAIISIILLISKKKIYVSDLLETLVSIAGSWILVLSLIVKTVITILNFTGKNKLIYKSKKDKTDDKKLIRTK